jgi:hypothetical protein
MAAIPGNQGDTIGDETSPPGTFVDHSGGGGGATVVRNGDGTLVLNSSDQQITVG